MANEMDIGLGKLIQGKKIGDALIGRWPELLELRWLVSSLANFSMEQQQVIQGWKRHTQWIGSVFIPIGFGKLDFMEFATSSLPRRRSVPYLPSNVAHFFIKPGANGSWWDMGLWVAILETTRKPDKKLMGLGWDDSSTRREVSGLSVKLVMLTV